MLSAGARGAPVHAASFIRQRRIVLERELLQHPEQLARILVHELFHFVWPRLGNPVRASFEQLLAAEHAAQARGEIGESAAAAKQRVTEPEGRRWREYVCEAFCDTAAFALSRESGPAKFGLGKRWIGRRLQWFGRAIDWDQQCF